MSTRVIAIANQKGGVGKTTTVINLSACLAEKGRRILVVDLDPQANATSGLGLPKLENASLYRVMLGDGDVRDLIKTTPVDGVDMIPAELDLAGCEVEIARTDNYLQCLKNVISPLAAENKYNFIFLDCPPSLGILTMNALTAADSMLIPMQCEYYALEGLSTINRLVGQLQSCGANPDAKIEGILMTMFDGRTNLSDEVVGEVRKHFGGKVYRTVIPRNVRLSEAPSYGIPIIRYDAHSSGAKAYRHLAREFLSRMEGTPAPHVDTEDTPAAAEATPAPDTAPTPDATPSEPQNSPS